MKTKIISFLAIFSVLNTIPAFAAGGGGFSTMEEVVGEDESAVVEEGSQQQNTNQFRQITTLNSKKQQDPITTLGVKSVFGTDTPKLNIDTKPTTTSNLPKVTGTVTRSDGSAVPYARILVIDENNTPIQEEITAGSNGQFELSNVPQDSKIKVLYMSDTITVPVEEIMDIKLPGNTLAEVVIGGAPAAAPIQNDTQEQPTITPTTTTGPDMQKLKDTVAEKQGKVDDAKAKEQSNANKLLTAGATAAAGIGGMELMQGISEQKSTKESEQNMASYIATMRCRYGNGKQVKAGTDEIELPGGNNSNIMQYRSEYFTLAKDLKERKVALNMTPGIESEEILDKSQMGLYDDENLGMNSGAYSSVYRAQMYNSETDTTQIDDAKQTAKNRMIGGGVAAGVGVAGGIVGDQLLNGELGQKIKENKNKK